MKEIRNLALLPAVLMSLSGACSTKDESANAPAVPAPQVTPKADCSVSLHGPPMVEVTAPNGIGYCIDRTEVTKAQYYEFVDAVQEDHSFQDPRCGSNNVSYEPYTYDNGNCHNFGSPGLNSPMVCVDWCDATAYCTWAGKRLCGKVGGGPINAPSVDVDGNFDTDISAGTDPNVSQWQNACSQGGRTNFAFGDNNDTEPCSSTAPSQSCRGSMPPYDNIFDLGGSVGEWEDLCGIGGCVIRGMPLAGTGSGACIDFAGVYSRTGISAEFSNVGFRCCAD